ncbi:MAG: hypothetical protein ABSH53_01785 [Holophaga sp.]
MFTRVTAPSLMNRAPPMPPPPPPPPWLSPPLARPPATVNPSSTRVPPSTKKGRWPPAAGLAGSSPPERVRGWSKGPRITTLPVTGGRSLPKVMLYAPVPGAPASRANWMPLTPGAALAWARMSRREPGPGSAALITSQVRSTGCRSKGGVTWVVLPSVACTW